MLNTGHMDALWYECNRKLPVSLYHGCIHYTSIIESNMLDCVLREFGYVETLLMCPITPNKDNKTTNSNFIEYR